MGSLVDLANPNSPGHAPDQSPALIGKNRTTPTGQTQNQIVKATHDNDDTQVILGEPKEAHLCSFFYTLQHSPNLDMEKSVPLFPFYGGRARFQGPKGCGTPSHFCCASLGRRKALRGIRLPVSVCATCNSSSETSRNVHMYAV